MWAGTLGLCRHQTVPVCWHQATPVCRGEENCFPVCCTQQTLCAAPSNSCVQGRGEENCFPACCTKQFLCAAPRSPVCCPKQSLCVQGRGELFPRVLLQSLCSGKSRTVSPCAAPNSPCGRGEENCFPVCCCSPCVQGRAELFPRVLLRPTSSSALMLRRRSSSWKRSRLLVPMGCSSSSLHRATSCGLSRCSRVSSSSKSLEKRTISCVLGCCPLRCI